MIQTRTIDVEMTEAEWTELDKYLSRKRGIKAGEIIGALVGMEIEAGTLEAQEEG